VKKPALSPIDTTAEALLPPTKRDSLAAWFELYMAIEAGPEDSNTFKAKRRDLQAFLDYFLHSVGTDHPDQWTRSISEGFLQYLLKDRPRPLAPTSVNRMASTVKHAARWIHRQRAFLVGNPTERVVEIAVEDPEWKGLARIQVNRLKSAAEQLIHVNTRRNQNPLRDYAMFLMLLHTALRVSELLSLRLRQYDGKYLRDIQRKGKKITRQLLLAKPAREALDRYIEETRGKQPGPLVQSRSGRRLAPQNVDEALKKIAAHASATLPEGERIHLTAHLLRHTTLRRAAEKEDIRYAMKLSGHTSSKYIWRYTEPSKEDEERALEELF
jgi:integrase/recombinase XerD